MDSLPLTPSVESISANLTKIPLPWWEGIKGRGKRVDE